MCMAALCMSLQTHIVARQTPSASKCQCMPSTTDPMRAFAPLVANYTTSIVKQHRTKAFQSRTRATRSGPSIMASWVEEDSRRMLHAVYRVGDMDKTIKWYQDNMGMKLLRYRDIPEGKYSNAFLGYGDERENFVLEVGVSQC